MATTIADVRQAIAEAVELTGLRCYPYVEFASAPPCAYVDRRGGDPELTFGATRQTRVFRVRCLFGLEAERESQERMDEHCEMSGTASIYAAIANENNWPDNLVHYAKVLMISDPSLTDVGGISYLTVEFDVEVVW